GIGGGMIQPIGQSMLVRAAGPSRLGRIISITVLPITFAPVLGPVLGGLVLQNLDWRWMFLVNVPIGLLTLTLAARMLPRDETRAPTTSRLDVLGLGLLSPGLAGVVYGFSEAGNVGGFGSARVLVTLVGGWLLVLGYVVHALRMD